MEIIIASIIGILLSIAVGLLVYRIMHQQLTRTNQQLASTEQILNEEQTKVQELKLFLSQKELELKYEKEKNESTRQQADEKLAEQIKFLQAELTNTTQKLLDIRSEKLEQTNRTQMSSIIDPLKETISKLEKEMKDTQTQHGNTTTRLEQSIKNLVEKTESIGNRADRLVETLLYQPKSQGDWGEIVVKEMLESQGLKEGIHYVYQPTLRDEKGQTLRNEETNRIMRPDFILHLDVLVR